MVRIGLDVGATKTVGLLCTESGRVLHRVRQKSAVKDPEQLYQDIRNLIQKLTGEAPERPAAACIGIAAFVDHATGHIHYAPNLQVENVPLGHRLQRDLGMPIHLDNDVNCGVLGETRFGAAKGVRHVVGLFIGTGIGAGIVTHGHLLRGARGIAAEAGHMLFIPGGRACGCGRRGCFEAYAGGRFINETVIRACRTHPKSGLCAEADKNLSGVWRAMSDGDPVARQIWDKAILALRVLVTNLVTLFDPEMVLLGGTVVHELPQVADSVREFLVAQRLRGILHTIPLTQAVLGGDAVALGAACLPDQP